MRTLFNTVMSDVDRHFDTELNLIDRYQRGFYIGKKAASGTKNILWRVKKLIPTYAELPRVYTHIVVSPSRSVSTNAFIFVIKFPLIDATVKPALVLIEQFRGEVLFNVVLGRQLEFLHNRSVFSNFERGNPYVTSSQAEVVRQLVEFWDAAII